MAAKNSVKTYIENGFYHLYNRGVNKAEIFHDQQDFGTFLSYIKTYLLPKDELKLHSIISSKESTRSEKQKASKDLSLKNYDGKIELLAYALMPNHFHLLIKQDITNGIDHFMNSLCTRYAGYFNRRNKRVGPLYQGVYKAVLFQNDEQFLHLSRYIHLNPAQKLGLNLQNWQESLWPTSLPEYLGIKNTPWIKTKYILDYFNKTNKNNTYLTFMSDNQEEKMIAPVSIDFEDE